MSILSKKELLDSNEDLSEYDVLGLDAVDDVDYDDENVDVSVGGNGEIYNPSDRYLETIDPESIVAGKELYCARTYAEYESYIRNYSCPGGKMTYDIETNAESPYSINARIIGFSNAFSGKSGIYVLRESLDYTMPEEDWNQIVKLLLDTFENHKSVVVHNCQYEVPYTYNNFEYLFSPDKIEDSMIKLRVTFPGERSGLKPASAKYLGYSDWDSELALYSSSTKKIINYLNYIYTSKNPKITELDQIIYSQFLSSETNQSEVMDPNDLWNLITDRSFNQADQITSLSVSMQSVLQVLSLNKALNKDLWVMYLNKIFQVGKVGLDTDVIAYSLIPSQILAKYGALDSISTYELDDFVNEKMIEKSDDARARIERMSGESSDFDLHKGYDMVKKQFFAGINLEMAGAYWDDEVASKEYTWYNDKAKESWLNMINNPLMTEKLIDQLLPYELQSLVASAGLEMYAESRVSSFNQSINEILTQFYNWIKSNEDITLQKSGVRYNQQLVETSKGTAKPLRITYKRLLDSRPDYYQWFMTPGHKEVFHDYILSCIHDDVAKCDDYREISKKYYNPSSTDQSHYELVDQILVTDDLKLAAVYDWVVLQSHEPEPYWKTSSGAVKSGYEGTEQLMTSIDHMLKYNKECEDNGNKPIPQADIFKKFKVLLEYVNLNEDYKLREQIIECNNFHIDALKEPMMIRLYDLFKFTGIDIEDTDTWTLQFKWLYDFRMYKKCAKMITSYIEGSVGRSSVMIVKKEDLDKQLPKRIRPYYYYKKKGIDLSPYDPETEACIMTSPWKVCLADTGRWKGALHCLHPDTKIKLTDGRDITVEQLCAEFHSGKTNYVYSLRRTDDGKYRFIIDSVKDVYISYFSKRMLRVTLDNGEYFEVTPDHKMVNRAGEYIEAQYLDIGDSLYPVCLKSADDDVLIYNPDQLDYSSTSNLWYMYNVENNLVTVYDQSRYDNDVSDDLCDDRRVVSMKYIDYPDGVPVYSVAINEDNPSFALSCGVVSKNTVPTGSTIKNIYRSRYTGGSIVSPDYCLSPDTRIKLLDGTSPTIKELAEKYGTTDTYEVYAYDHATGEVRPAVARNTRVTKIADEIYKITLDNGKSIECTDNHPFLTRDGEYVRADRLEVGQYLMTTTSEVIDQLPSTVKSIVVLDKTTPVYDLEVDNYHNFLVDLGDNSGVFVHNSQMEVRTIAAASHEESMLDAYRRGADIHRQNACFTGDTKVILSHGESMTFEELASKFEEVGVLSYEMDTGHIVESVGHNPQITKYKSELVEVKLTKGASIKCTPHHKWLTKRGYVDAIDLRSDDELVSFTFGSEEMMMEVTNLETLRVVEVVKLTELQDVYDLEVPEHHNFSIEVAPNYGAVVHNSKVWKKKPEDITDAERRFSKMVTFAILYGADAHNIANNFMGGDLQAATDLLNNFYEAFPKLKSWIDARQSEWKETEHVTTMTNRLIRLPKPSRDDPKAKYKFSKLLRQAQNFPIQGSASDIAGTVLWMVIDYIQQTIHGYTKGFSFVHDALYFDIHPNEIFEVCNTVVDMMDNYPNENFGIPAKADMVLGISMGQELELEMIKRIDEKHGVVVMSGFEDDFDECIENWRKAYKSVNWIDIDPPKPKYIGRSELFVPKKAISPYYGLTRTKIHRKIVIEMY